MYAPLFFRKVNSMKKSKIIALASAVSLTAAAVFAATSMASAAPALGDVDCNGKVTASDARMILRHSAKLENLSDSVIPVADADGNGKVSATDARLVLRFASKLISTMGGEDKYAEFIKSNESSDTSPTTKKTDSSDLSTRPVTRPTTKPAAELSTKPTTAPTTAPTTEPTTVPTTAPTTAPTTEPEETTKAPLVIPDDIKAFASVNFAFTGTSYSSEGTMSMKMATNGKNLRVYSKMPGFSNPIGIMHIKGRTALSSKYYLFSEETMQYADATASINMAGGIDGLNIPFEPVEIPVDKMTVEENVAFNGKETTCYKLSDETSTIRFYMDGDHLVGVSMLDSVGNIQQEFVFTSFSGDVPDSTWSLDGYSKKSLMELAFALVK